MKEYILKSYINHRYNLSQAENKKCHKEKINSRLNMIFRTQRITL